MMLRLATPILMQWFAKLDIMIYIVKVVVRQPGLTYGFSSEESSVTTSPF